MPSCSPPPSVIPLPVNTYPPVGPASVVPPNAPSSAYPLVDPATSASPLVGFDQGIMLAPAITETQAHAPTDEHFSYCDNSSQTSSISTSPGFRADFVAKVQIEYRTLDMYRVSRIQSLQFSPSTNRTAATRLLIRSICDALSFIPLTPQGL